MRPAIRKSTKAPAPRKLPKSPKVDHAKTALKLRKAVQEMLTEIKLARGYMASQYAGPEHEALEWAQSVGEKAVML